MWKKTKTYTQEKSVENIQNFETCTVSYAIRYRPSQIVASYITDNKISTTKAKQFNDYEATSP